MSDNSIRRHFPLVLCLTILICIGISPVFAESSGNDTYTYDANGNMISGFGLNFVYNDANQLVEISNQSTRAVVAQYYYDDAGNRIRKQEGGVDTYYIGEYFETRVNGSTIENTSYYFANNERIADNDDWGPGQHWYHSDHLGSTSIVTDSTGDVVESVEYYPYGAIDNHSGSGRKYLYTDQELDPESGLYYYGARYYSPEIMRFAQPDPVIQDVYNPQNLNRYSYVLNNPLIFVDPTGKNAQCQVDKGAVLVKIGYFYCKDPDTGQFIKGEIWGAKVGGELTHSFVYMDNLPSENSFELKFGASGEVVEGGVVISGEGGKLDAGVEGSVSAAGIVGASAQVMASGEKTSSVTVGPDVYLVTDMEVWVVRDKGYEAQQVFTSTPPSSVHPIEASFITNRDTTTSTTTTTTSTKTDSSKSSELNTWAETKEGEHYNWVSMSGAAS